jgi:hypothetical protein
MKIGVVEPSTKPVFRMISFIAIGPLPDAGIPLAGTPSPTAQILRISPPAAGAEFVTRLPS